jgi:mannosyltransferase OCH1-like enzyme
MELIKIFFILILLLLLIYILFRKSEHFKHFEHFENNIPKVIYLCYKTKDIPSKIIETWKKFNPEYEVKIFDNTDCEKFLLENYGQKHIDIFNYIKDGPIKACFFRICILNKNGGVYSDIDVEPFVPIKDFIEDGVLFATCNSMHNGMLNPHFIYSIQNHPILKRCVEIYEEKYDKKDAYEYWSWGSPHIMVQSFRDIFGENFEFNG